ncbi:hypothetical protein ACU4HD_21960 [Cupriavidus basilensis]
MRAASAAWRSAAALLARADEIHSELLDAAGQRIALALHLIRLALQRLDARRLALALAGQIRVDLLQLSQLARQVGLGLGAPRSPPARAAIPLAA